MRPTRDAGPGGRFVTPKNLLGAAIVSLALLGPAGAALAHHSFAMFDNEHQQKVVGTVTAVEWTNPHVYIQVEVADADGKVHPFAVECANPGILNRVGWKFNLIRPGDKVKMIIAPLRSGEAGGLLHEIVLPDGRVFNNGGFAGPATLHF